MRTPSGIHRQSKNRYDRMRSEDITAGVVCAVCRERLQCVGGSQSLAQRRRKIHKILEGQACVARHDNECSALIRRDDLR